MAVNDKDKQSESPSNLKKDKADNVKDKQNEPPCQFPCKIGACNKVYQYTSAANRHMMTKHYVPANDPGLYPSAKSQVCTGV